MHLRPLRPTLFPYTTLFRSRILAIPTKKTDHPLVNHLSMAEMHAILDAPNVRTRAGLRDRAMIHLCFAAGRSDEHTSELQSRVDLVCRLLLEKKNINNELYA